MDSLSQCPGPRLNCDSALLYLETCTWSRMQPMATALLLPVPPLTLCSWNLFSFPSNSTLLLPQANICLLCTLLFNTQGKNEPSCWRLGPWANKLKRKMVCVGVMRLKKTGREWWLKSLYSEFRKNLPFSPPNLHYFPDSKEWPLQFVSEGKENTADPGYFHGMGRAV